jgi:hypothetical protein
VRFSEADEITVKCELVEKIMEEIDDFVSLYSKKAKPLITLDQWHAMHPHMFEDRVLPEDYERPAINLAEPHLTFIDEEGHLIPHSGEVVDAEYSMTSASDYTLATPVMRLPLEVSAVYGKHPDAWVEEHPNAEDDEQLVDADFHVVRKYRESLKPREGNCYDIHNECMRNSAGNVNGNTVDAEQDRTKVTLFSA